jgi:hypothetical protein
MARLASASAGSHRISAALHMNLEDYYPQGKRWWLRLQEKGGENGRTHARATEPVKKLSQSRDLFPRQMFNRSTASGGSDG